MVWVLHMKGEVSESIYYLLNIGVCGFYLFFLLRGQISFALKK